MRTRRATRLALTVLTSVIAFEAAAIGLSWQLEPASDTLLYALYAVALAGSGALIVSRQPRNAVAWLLIVLGIWNAAVADAAQGWGLRASQEDWAGGQAAELIALSSWLPAAVPTVLLFLVFPEGKPSHRRWLHLVWIAGAGALIGTLGFSLDPDTGREFAGGTNPAAVGELPTKAMAAIGLAVTGAAMAGAALSLLLRLRQSRGIERQQLKWFAFAAMWAAVVPPTVAAVWYALPWLRPLTAIALTGVPVAATIAILRYRLYDIDLVISRTILYLALTGLLGSAWAALALLLGAIVGADSAWAVAGSTAIVLIAFRPLRDRLQRSLDRHFQRAQFAALRRMATFEDDLRAGRAIPESIEATMKEALGDPTLELRYRLPGHRDLIDTRGQACSDSIPGEKEAIPIFRGGTMIGQVVHSRALPAPLLAPVLVAAGLAIEIARLRLEIRRQLDEVTASRARIVASADEERRRMERDLHDGAQQRFVAIGLALRHAQHELAGGAIEQASGTLDLAVSEIGIAIDELRELARGLRPACLDDGLEAALRELAERAPIDVEVVADRRRFRAEIETAAYFVACEGVTNAVKHAHASKIHLEARATDGKLVVAVKDNGAGGASAPAGGGLLGLSDRVAAHGGHFTIESTTGSGTRLVAEFPCES